MKYNKDGGNSFRNEYDSAETNVEDSFDVIVEHVVGTVRINSYDMNESGKTPIEAAFEMIGSNVSETMVGGTYRFPFRTGETISVVVEYNG